MVKRTEGKEGKGKGHGVHGVNSCLGTKEFFQMGILSQTLLFIMRENKVVADELILLGQGYSYRNKIWSIKKKKNNNKNPPQPDSQLKPHTYWYCCHKQLLEVKKNGDLCC